MPMTLDWLIVGGGIHGVHIAARLIGEAGISPARVRIVDPHARLLARWRRCTAVTGMTHLRSPTVHHLDLGPWSLRHFAGKPSRRKPGLFAHPYDRPALTLFDAHSDQVIERYGIAPLHIQAQAVSGTLDCDGTGVLLDDGTQLRSRKLVLALGAGDQPEWPGWAPPHHPSIHHVFDPAFDGWPSAPETVVVLGGGISAAQVALRLHREGHRVHLVSRHASRAHQFDSDPGWLGPRYMARFNREENFGRRRTAISEARHRGSVPPDIQRALRRATRKGHIDRHEASVVGFHPRPRGVELQLSTGEVLMADRVLLSTGLASRRPGGKLIDDLIRSASLPCAQCGYPIVDASLRWQANLHVTGPLAELEIGPTARNIAGARRAGDRLVAAATAG